jgi:23S rRNA (pseudouridine1915-N3)-methyltransferase
MSGGGDGLQRILILTVGRASKGPERELIERYHKRITPLAKNLGFGKIELKTIPESQKSSASARRAEEAQKILALVPKGALIALDEKGKAIDSAGFAKMMQNFRDTGQSAITYIIGGPDGLDESTKSKADKIIAFGAMTFPHQLVAALLMEQIYRGLTILSGHPYHRS